MSIPGSSQGWRERVSWNGSARAVTGCRRNAEHHDLPVGNSAIPRSVVYLVSALQFHNIGTQLPHQVWLAVSRGTRVPRLTTPPLRVVSIAPEVFDLGIEEHRVEGQVMRVYSVARTVSDCFRFRNTVGLDVAARGAHRGVAQQTPQDGGAEPIA